MRGTAGAGDGANPNLPRCFFQHTTSLKKQPPIPGYRLSVDEQPGDVGGFHDKVQR